ncbi:hypothetical protein D3C76_1188400 [compost metagenome]
MLHEHPHLGLFRQPVRQIGGGAAATQGAIGLGMAYHAHGQVHLLFHLALGGGDGVEARGERAQQRDELFGAESGGEALEHIHHLGRGDQGIDLGLVPRQILQGGVARDVGQAGDEAAVQPGQLEMLGQRGAQRALGGGFIAIEAGQGQHLAHQRGIVVEPDPEGIPRLVADAGLRQVDLDVTDVLGRVAAGDLLVE